MSALFILIGASLSAAIGFLIMFIWAVKRGQFEDTYTPSVRMLHDDLDTPPQSSEEQKT